MALDLNDKTANGNNLSNVNSATEVTASLPFSESSTAVDFEASSSQYLKTTAELPETDGLEAMTIEAWVKYESRTVDSNQIASQWNAANNDNKFIIRIHASNDDELRIFIASGTSDASNFADTTDLNLSNDTWTHLAFVYDGTQLAANRLKVYKNGNAVTLSITGTIPAALTTQTNTTFWIGVKGGGSAEYFDGQMDDIRLWSTARSQAQIQANKDIELAGTETGLLAYWPLEAVLGSPKGGYFFTSY